MINLYQIADTMLCYSNNSHYFHLNYKIWLKLLLCICFLINHSTVHFILAGASSKIKCHICVDLSGQYSTEQTRVPAITSGQSHVMDTGQSGPAGEKHNIRLTFLRCNTPNCSLDNLLSTIFQSLGNLNQNKSNMPIQTLNDTITLRRYICDICDTLQVWCTSSLCTASISWTKYAVIIFQF